MRYDASFSDRFSRSYLCSGLSRIRRCIPTLLLDIFATLVCKSLVVQCVASIIDPPTRNSAIHVPLIIAIFDPPLWCANHAHESGNRRNAVKPYHYAVVYKRMPALCVRFVNASVQRGALCYHTLVRYFSGQLAKP